MNFPFWVSVAVLLLKYPHIYGNRGYSVFGRGFNTQKVNLIPGTSIAENKKQKNYLTCRSSCVIFTTTDVLRLS